VGRNSEAIGEAHDAQGPRRRQRRIVLATLKRCHQADGSTQAFANAR
jgi:hypothetical protein